MLRKRSCYRHISVPFDRAREGSKFQGWLQIIILYYFSYFLEKQKCCGKSRLASFYSLQTNWCHLIEIMACNWVRRWRVTQGKNPDITVGAVVKFNTEIPSEPKIRWVKWRTIGVWEREAIFQETTGQIGEEPWSLQVPKEIL